MRTRAPSRKIFVVRTHPVRESFVGAACDRAVMAFGASGHDVRVVDLYDDGFEPGAAPMAQRYVDTLRWCDTIVFAYPTWFGSQPAMLKGWLDVIVIDGIAFAARSDGRRAKGLLRNVRRLMVITSHGSPKWMNALQGEPGKRVLLRGFRSLCHPLARSEWVAFYDNDGCDQRARADFLNRVEAVALRL